MSNTHNPLHQALQLHIQLLAQEVAAIENYGKTHTLSSQQRQYHAMRLQAAQQRHASALHILRVAIDQRIVRRMDLLEQTASLIQHGTQCPYFQAWKLQRQK